MIKKLLIANRGEIALRIARTARRLGIAVSTVHSTADRDGLHVRNIGESVAIGGAAASQSYLNVEAILRAAAKVGADAVHPGIGFLAEEPKFAEAVEAQGLIFVGPRPQTLQRFADKWAAKHEARQAGVPVIGGSEGSSNDPAAVASLIQHGMRLPVVLKAAAGGGGRGVRIVRDLEGLPGVIESAMREAQSSFGRPDLIVEEFVEEARHLEVQVAGDGRGGAIHLAERECSLQRRFQKVIEEAPAANLPASVRERLLTDAVNLARRVEYRNVGTMEFLVSGDRHYFLECNPRLQVEHTVTEEVTGIDLVELQLNIAAYGKLPFEQDHIVPTGHAIEARVCAENTAQGFVPSTGRLQHVVFPAGVRVETGVETGSEITPYYDPMIAKLIVHGADRSQALARLLAAIEGTVLFGVDTNLEFLKRLLNEPVVRAGTADNRFIDRELTKTPVAVVVEPELPAVAAVLLLRHWNVVSPQSAQSPWGGGGEFLGWRYAVDDGAAPRVPEFTLTGAGERSWAISLGACGADGIGVFVNGENFKVHVDELGESRYHVQVREQSLVLTACINGESVQLQHPDGRYFRFAVVPFLSLDALATAQGGQVRAPMMGVLAKVRTKVGDVVRRGDILVVQESMKMELNIEAPCDGQVATVNCAEGNMVERHQILVEITPGQPSA